jgi:TfoX/Sxy family transcriptional regulator of competence genes
VPPRLQHCGMAYDEALAERIRGLIGDEAAVTEKKMFGGLAFLVGGNMAVAASGQGGLMVRVDPADSEMLVQTTPAEVMVMRRRAMAGWLRLASSDVASRDELAEWVARGVAFARSLPAK